MILKELKLNTYVDSPTNCYIIFDENSKEAMVIDPGGEFYKIDEMLKILKANVKYIYITHCHGDHIGAINELKKNYGGKILISRTDSQWLNNPQITLTRYIGMEDIELDVDSRVDDNDLIHIGDIELQVINTPGHTKGSTSLYCKEYKMLFSGDTLFKGTWGRTDLPTSSLEDIMDSITKRLLILPDDTIVYPGHGKATMIQEEKPIYLELKPNEY